MKNKTFLLLVLIAVLVCSLPGVAFGENEGAGKVSDLQGELSGRFTGNADEGFYNPISLFASDIVHNERFDTYELEKGIDVSYWNGTIDWESVAEDDIDFAFVRIGGKFYVSGDNYFDDYYEVNLDEAREEGLDTGVYFFSQAITEEEAVEEAKYVLKLLDGRELQLPIVLDFEYASGGSGLTGRLYEADLTDRERTDICLAFCKTVEAAGYEGAVYANAAMLEDDLYAEEIAQEYDIWLAQWGTTTDYEGDYTYWQYSDEGTVDGISGSTDLNFRYTPTFKADNETYGEISLEWKTVDDADGYILARTDEEGNETAVTLAGKETVSYTDTDVKPGKKYTYQLKYYRNENDIAVEYESSYPAVEMAGKLKAPKVSAENNEDSGKIVLTWNAVEGADKYEIYRATSETGIYEPLYTANGTKFTNTSVKAGNKYYYKVKAVSEVSGMANSALSTAVSRTCDLAKPVVAAGNNLSTGKIKLTWDEVEGAEKYKVYRATSKNGTYKLMYTTENTSYTNSSAEIGKTYYYKVKAVIEDCSAAASSYSEKVLRTCDCARPVVSGTNVASSGKVKLTWDKVEGAEKYKVYRATSKSGTYKLVFTTESTSYTNSSAEAEKTYYYKVKAINEDSSAANSAYSKIVTRTCDLARPVIKVTRTAYGNPKVSWNKVSGADKYYIYRKTGSSGEWKYYTATSKTSYINSSVKAGTKYYYKVKAVSTSKSAANSAYSLSKYCVAK